MKKSPQPTATDAVMVLLTDKEITRIASSCCAAVLPPIDQIEGNLDEEESQVRLTNFAMAGLDSRRNLVAAGWAYRKDLWPNRTVLRYRFMNGDSTQRARMRELFRKADTFVGVAFKEVTAGPSECRVAFNDSGHWSYVGIQNKRIPQHLQTMNISLSRRDSSREWYRVGMHEIFHWLGMGHEHQHPRNTIPWIVPRVYQVYGRTQGWSIEDINYQVINRPTSVGMDGTPTADKGSLMMYPIDEYLVSDSSYAVGWNYVESELDRVILRRFYHF